MVAVNGVSQRYRLGQATGNAFAWQCSKRDKIHYTIRPSGEVVLKRAEAMDSNGPVLDQFLVFLVGDVMQHPDRLRALDEELVHRMQYLVGDVEVDLDSALSEDDE